MWGLGFRVKVEGCSRQGNGFQVQDSGFRISSFGSRISDFGFRVSSFGFGGYSEEETRRNSCRPWMITPATPSNTCGRMEGFKFGLADSALRFEVWGLGFRVWGVVFGVWGLGFGV